jgi:serine/threonine protein kinase
MSLCPKCKKSVGPSEMICIHCGGLLAPTQDDVGTLNPEQFIQGSGILTPKPDSLQEDEVSDSIGTAETMDSSQEPNPSDDIKTLELPNPAEPTSGDSDAGTMMYSETDIKSATGRSGVSSGSVGLKRIWAEAIGSSGKDSNQSLRHELAEASDSVFRRVATRQILDANSTASQSADYQIQDKLGAGAMGIVFSARQTAVDRIVAIKTISAEKRENESSRRQFFYEAEVTADLDHPNIPPIYELGRTEDGSLFYSMKLIRGAEWQTLIKKNTREANLEIFSKIADAVSFAHSRNVIHRDLKPSNVMIGTYGEVYVTDWGLAVNMTKSKNFTFGGTPDFMAPEMARHKRELIGKASDIYLLGGILYQIITGTPPHMGRTAMDRLASAQRNDFAPTDIVDPLLDIAHRAMETEPAARFASVVDMQKALGDVKRHAESISLAKRCTELMESAIDSKDYDRFTRSIFGFRDAIDMWGENKLATVGLQKARFAYGQCAFGKGDYDLALQTLDRSVAEEAVIYDKAVKAKHEVQQRESRFKTLRNVFVVAVSVLSLIASAFAFLANQQTGIANKQRGIAESKTVEAERNAMEAMDQRMIAEMNAKEATDQRMIAERNEKDATSQRMIAERNEKEATRQRRIAEINAKEATDQRKIAEVKKVEADEQRKIAVANEKLAKEEAARIRIGDSRSSVSQAILSTQQFDIKNATQQLQKLSRQSSDVFAGRAPKFNDSFPLKRIGMLTNADIPQQEFGGAVSAIDFAPSANMGIVGTEDGKVRIIRMEAGQLLVDATPALQFDFPGGKIESVAISPNGDEAILSTTIAGKGKMFVWPLDSRQTPAALEATENRSFQTVAYSPDGSKILAGINGGIWIIQRSENWYANTSKDEAMKQRFNKTRGKLNPLQWQDADTILATSEINGELRLYQLDIPSNTSKIITLPQPEFRNLSVAARLARNNHILLGSADGKLSTAEVVPAVDDDGRATLTIANVVHLADKHRAAVTRLLTNIDGRILSISNGEPVAHIWKYDANGNVSYDTYLTGVPSKTTSTPNLSNAAFVSPSLILGVDTSGTAMAWDVERQKQRRQLTRSSKNGPDDYLQPVVGIFDRGSSGSAICITRDGVIDLWDLQTGKTQEIDGDRWSYFGHTPGAEYVDSAIDLNKGIVVTSASLRNAQTRYLADPTHNWEFCVWDHATGNMLHRWSKRAETNGKQEIVEPRIALLGNGDELLIASDNETRIVSLDGKDLFLKEKIGTYIAVPNPRDPSLIAMVKRSGFTWFWNRSSDTISEANFGDETSSGYPLKGIWSEDGSRFFLVYSNCFIKVFSQVDQKLEATKTFDKVDQVRVSSHYDMDLATSSITGGDRLFVNVRSTNGSKTTSRLVTLQLPLGAEAATFSAVDSDKQTWLEGTTGGVPNLKDRVHNRFAVQANSPDKVRSRFKLGEHTFVSTKSGIVYDLMSNSSKFDSVGRQELLAATSDRDGKMIMTLHLDGSLWRFDLSDDGTGSWRKLAYAATGADTIAISPDAKLLATWDRETKKLKVLDASTGETAVPELEGVAACCWDPRLDATLALARVDGRVELWKADGKVALDSVKMENDSEIRTIRFFEEKFDDPTQSRRYLLVQTEDKFDGYLQFVDLPSTVEPNAAEGQRIIRNREKLEKIKKDTVIATSMEDSVFAIGDGSGTVTLWFASPSWDNVGPLFDLEGHRGAKIEAIAFSRDGSTLITSDERNRLLGWLSIDKTLVKPHQ